MARNNNKNWFRPLVFTALGFGAGAIFGGLKYALLLSLFLFFFHRINISTGWLSADKKAESKFYYPILHI